MLRYKKKIKLQAIFFADFVNRGEFSSDSDIDLLKCEILKRIDNSRCRILAERNAEGLLERAPRFFFSIDFYGTLMANFVLKNLLSSPFSVEKIMIKVNGKPYFTVAHLPSLPLSQEHEKKQGIPDDIIEQINDTLADEGIPVNVHLGWHEHHLLPKDSTVKEFHSAEQAIDYYQMQRKIYGIWGYQVWYAYLTDLDGNNKTELDSVAPY